jgi:hypothetical protein
MISQNRYKGQPLASALGTVDPRAVRTSTTVIARKSLLILKVSFESYVSLVRTRCGGITMPGSSCLQQEEYPKGGHIGSGLVARTAARLVSSPALFEM